MTERQEMKAEDPAAKRFEIVPLEALRVEKNQVLVLRLPKGIHKEYVEGARKALNDVGLKDRVLLLAGDIDVTVADA